jgi:hypothetical protein
VCGGPGLSQGASCQFEILRLEESGEGIACQNHNYFWLQLQNTGVVPLRTIDARSTSVIQASFDLDRAHRWFAVEFNNSSWELVESAHRSVDDVERMIHLAHAAFVHWLHAGNVANEVRAYCLLATAYAAAGLGKGAVRYADKCVSLCAPASAELTEFDRASAFGCAANAYASAGDQEQARDFHQQASRTVAALESEDRALFEKLYPAP